MTRAQMVWCALLSSAVIVPMAALSRFPTSQAEPDEALIRLSWRIPGVAIQECRTLSEEELATIPAHMRRAQECTGGNADYELRVRVGSGAELVDTVGPAGARRDRPVYVLQDLPVRAGTHDVSVTFRALVPEGFDGGDQPLVYRWNAPVSAGSNEIAVLTVSESGGVLERLTAGR